MAATRIRVVIMYCILAGALLAGIYWLGPGEAALRALGFRVGGPTTAELLAAFTDAKKVDWTDLIPPDQSDAAMRLHDGTLARGVVLHGQIGPNIGPSQAEAPLPNPESSLSPEDLAKLVGAYTDIANSPARRAADSFGFGSMKVLQPQGGEIRSDLDGTDVQIAGFIAPIAFDGTKISGFLLVPYVGACIHVPPPPANQIVYVGDFQGYRPEGLLYPVRVTGKLRAAPVETDLANVGYRIENAVVELYQE